MTVLVLSTSSGQDEAVSSEVLGESKVIHGFLTTLGGRALNPCVVQGAAVLENG